jgi:hypothetical protein
MKSKTTWRAKLEKMQARQVKPGPKGRGMMLIPKPLDIDVIIRRIEKGKLVSDSAIREKLAADFKADYT